MELQRVPRPIKALVGLLRIRTNNHTISWSHGAIRIRKAALRGAKAVDIMRHLLRRPRHFMRPFSCPLHGLAMGVSLKAKWRLRIRMTVRNGLLHGRGTRGRQSDSGPIERVCSDARAWTNGGKRAAAGNGRAGDPGRRGQTPSSYLVDTRCGRAIFRH